MSFMLFVLVRLSSVLLVQTSFVADEYWQSLEVAHRWVFGYGYLTWEWRERLRSVLFPGLFAALYKLLALLHLDTVWLLTTLPRVLSAVITAVGDASTLRLAEKIFGPACRRWVTLCLLSCWFLQYCAPRTITAVPESTFTALALAAYPWYSLQVSGSLRYLWWVGMGCVLRPTTALLFVPLFTAHLLARYHVGAASKLLSKAVLIGLSVSACLCCADSLYYGRLTFVPWHFLRFNALSGGLADHYGTHPWHWYLSSGLPSALGPHFVPLLLGVWRAPERYAKLLVPVGFTLAAYSCVGHKEIRLLLPLLPPLLAVTGDHLSQVQSVCVNNMDSFFHRTWIVVPWLTVPSTVLLLVMGLLHQRGPLAIMDVLHGRLLPEWHRQRGEASYDQHSTHEAFLLFLTPCHSTPLYSHLHVNVSVRFLTCEPNLHQELNYIDEADLFYKHPEAWLAAHFPSPPGVSEAVEGDDVPVGGAALSEGNGKATVQVGHQEKQQKRSNIDELERGVGLLEKTLQTVTGVMDTCSIGEDSSDCSNKNIPRGRVDLGNRDVMKWLSLVTAYRYAVVEPLLTYPSHIIMFDSLGEQLKNLIESLGYRLCSSSYHSFAEDGRRTQYLNIYCLPP